MKIKQLIWPFFLNICQLHFGKVKVRVIALEMVKVSRVMHDDTGLRDLQLATSCRDYQRFKSISKLGPFQEPISAGPIRVMTL